MAQASRAYTSEYSTLGQTYRQGHWPGAAVAEPSPKPERVKRVRPRPQRPDTIIHEAETALITHKMLVRSIIFMAFVGAVLITTIWMSAKATQIKYSINQMQSENIVLENEISLLGIKIESANSIESIEEYATDKLGMQYPKSQQCIYIESGANASDDLAGQIREKAYK